MLETRWKNAEEEIGKKELQEDLLEQIIIWNENGIFDVAHLYAQENIENKRLTETLEELRNQGFLVKAVDSLCLTSYGRERAEMIRNRHEYLTAFIQIICNVGKESAEKNACRLEHIISEDVFLGICEYMLQGYETIRRVHIQDLRFFYKPGKYMFSASVYEAEARYPRILCQENKDIEQKILAVIGENSCFYLMVKETFAWKNVWYMKNKTWVKAEREENRFCLPGDIFTYLIHQKIQAAEGAASISFTNETFPDATDLRELNIHLIAV